MGESFQQSRNFEGNYSNDYNFSNGYSHNNLSTSPIIDNRQSIGTKSLIYSFEETGPNGNIALIGTNGITASSISSNVVASSDVYWPVTALFDGYRYDTWQVGATIFNQSSEGPIGYGALHSTRNTPSISNITIDLGNVASISGFVLLNQWSNRTGHPSDITIKSSVDGINYVPEQSFTFSTPNDSGVVRMSTPFKNRYFRLTVNRSYYVGYLVFSELEILQTQP
jgi:hypothetical protein